MSNDRKLTKKEKKAGAATPPDAAPAATEDDSAPGFAGYLVGGAVGFLLLIILWRGFGVDNEGPPVLAELPHLVVQAEFSDLSDPTVRNDLARLQVELAKISDPAPEVLGPLSHPILLSNPVAASDPIAKELNLLTKEEFEAARPYFKTGGWLAPRIFNEGLTKAVFRAGPTVGTRFGPGTRVRVEAVLKSFQNSSLKLVAYSHDLRFLEDEARNAINAEFGVQTANSWGVLLAGKSCRAEPKLLLEMDASFQRVEHDKIRTSITLVSFWSYAGAVMSATPEYSFSEISDEQYKVMDRLQKACRADGLVSRNGASALLFVTTSAEAEENVEVAQRVSGNTQGGGFVVHPYRPR